ncbi:helicase [Streptomyces lunaelactis]|nr:helicase [Streptomyces lunaelactis]NUK01102.1 helicase [Streptomyces lunaelactis]NUK16846.1 helicase [Streptomyces lunaelactis]
MKLGVFVSNHKTKRAKAADKLQQLAELGVEWTA